jgi:hypothetical protein
MGDANSFWATYNTIYENYMNGKPTKDTGTSVKEELALQLLSNIRDMARESLKYSKENVDNPDLNQNRMWQDIINEANRGLKDSYTHRFGQARAYHENEPVMFDALADAQWPAWVNEGLRVDDNGALRVRVGE